MITVLKRTQKRTRYSGKELVLDKQKEKDVRMSRVSRH